MVLKRARPSSLRRYGGGRSRRYVRRTARSRPTMRRGPRYIRPNWGRFAHFYNPKITRSLASASIELKYITRGLTNYVLKLPTITGTPYYGLANGLLPVDKPNALIVGGNPYPTLNSCTQGDNYGQRDGRQIVLRSLHMRGYVYLPSLSTSANIRDSDLVFVALVMDRQANSAPAPSELIFSNVNDTAAYPCAVTCVQNPHTKNRFRVLGTRMIPVRDFVQFGLGANTASTGCTIPFEFNINLKGTKVNFSVANSEAADAVVDNCINLYAWSMFDPATFAEQQLFISHQCEVRFCG